MIDNGNDKPLGSAELSPAKRRLMALLEKDRKQRAQRIISRPGDEPAPLSFGQRRLWFLDRWSPGSTTYNEFIRIRLEGQLDVEALRASLLNVVDRHAVLRTVYRATPDGPVQVVDPSLLPVIEHHDLSASAPAERAAALEALQQRELATPFDLAAGPLVRALLVRLGAEEHELLFSVHHIACDGWSLGIFVRELAICYAAFERGEAPPLPKLDLQYTDFARWQIESAETPTAAAQLAYWKRQLPEPAPLLEIPFARPRPATRSAAGITEFFTIDAELAARVSSLARDEDATPFMVLLTVFQALLHRYTGELDVRVGSPVAGRTRVETEALIGFFVNTLVLRGDFTGEPTFRELVRRTRAASLGAYANQDVPFEHLVDALGARRTHTHTPLFQAGFVLQNTPVVPLALPRLRVSPIEVDRGTAKFDLLLSLTETAGGLRGGLECSADLFDAATAARMVGHFKELLASSLAQPDERVAGLSLPTLASDELLQIPRARQAAAHPDPSAEVGESEAVLDQHPAIRGDLEKLLAEQWKQVLHLDIVGATDNFFEVGGNSLHMATLQSRLREQLGRDVPMVALFQYPTIRELAAYLAGAPAPAAPAEQAPARTSRRGAQAMRRELRRGQRGGHGDE